MDQTTQQNAALVEEASAAARALEEQARGMVQAVSVFRIGGDARRPARAALAAVG
jgi:methyl-accepting chemotaxis protein